MENHNEVLLKVDHLCQYFRLGRKDLKAVDDVSFEIRKGETFGLVGESGCGKTTTGRSIIKLYDITSGNVYFKGKRIGAGTRSYRDAIKNARAKAKKDIAELREKASAYPAKKEECEDKIQAIRGELAEIVAKNKELIRDAKQDHKEVDKQYAAAMLKALDKEYAAKFKVARGGASKLSGLKKELKKAKKNAAMLPKLEQQLLEAQGSADKLKALRKELRGKSDEERRKVLAQEIKTVQGDASELKALKKKLKVALTSVDEIPSLERKIVIAQGNAEKLKLLKKEYKSRRRVTKKSKLITQIQMIFQDPIASLDPRMTVRDIIAEGLIINGITDKDYINEKVYEILETVGLVREHADRYPHEFSGGQRQRIGIARSVIMRPEMIIADEPVSALDVSIQAQVINLLNDLRESQGLTILFIAHDLSVVKYFSDRIGVMYFGKMVELADSDELFKHPLHPYTKSLLSAIPLPDPIYEKQRVRITYNPLAEHDYSTDTPSFREISPGHFVYCNDAEEERYKQIISLDAEG